MTMANPHEDAKQIAGVAIFECIDWNRSAYGNPATDEDAWWFAETAIKALEAKGWRLVAPSGENER